MAATLLVCGDAGSGKTALCAALGRSLQGGGKRVTYFRPRFQLAPGKDEGGAFIRKALSLVVEEEALSPVLAPSLEGLLAQGNGVASRLKAAYSSLAQGMDVGLVEGLNGLDAETPQGQGNLLLAQALEARMVAVIRYAPSLAMAPLKKALLPLKDKLLGVVFNAVPSSWEGEVKEIGAALEKEGVKVLGLLPEERLLLGVSVDELARHLGGRVVLLPEKGDNLVEGVMLGAVCLDPATSYLGRKGNKAVITRGDRPDTQLAALETDTVCLVLTLNIPPAPFIVAYAHTKGIPVLVVPRTTQEVVEALPPLFSAPRFYHEKKLERLAQLVAQRLPSLSGLL